MQFFEHPDGSHTRFYEPGDRVLLKTDRYIGRWRTAKAGEDAEVVRVHNGRDRTPSCIAFLDLHTTPGWGTIRVPQWEVEPSLSTQEKAVRLGAFPGQTAGS